MIKEIIFYLFKLIFRRDILAQTIQADWHPEPQGEISSADVRKILADKGIPQTNIWISDDSYQKCKSTDILKFLSEDMIDLREYVPTKYDCDNFSFSLMGQASFYMSGYAIGIVWAKTKSGNHALNFFINEDGEFWFIEPQSDFIFKNSDYEPYFVVI